MKYLSIPTAVAALVALTPSAKAGTRPFVWSYEAETAPKGYTSFEQWATWKSYDSKDVFQFREEFEWAPTDNLQLGFYLANWEMSDATGDWDADFSSVGIEAIYSLLNPTKEPIGVALYGEITAGDDVFELEGKLLLQKNVGSWKFVYNAVVESEWEDSFEEKTGEWKNTFGVDYEFSPSFALGIEAMHEVKIDDWSDMQDHQFYAGPKVSYRNGAFFATLSPLVQLTDVSGTADFQTRIICGFHW
jgi:hypothetical protein